MAEIQAFGLKFNTDSLKNIKTPVKVGIGVAGSLLILGLMGYYQIYPKWEEYKQLQTKIEEQQIEISNKENKVKRLPELREELDQIRERLVVLRRKIPQAPNVPSLLLDLEEITENTSLFGNQALMKEFRPQTIVGFDLPAALQDASESETAKQLKQLPITVSLTDISYPDFIKLLNDYESYERTLSLEGISLIPVKDEDSLYSTVNATFTVKAFLLEGGT